MARGFPRNPETAARGRQDQGYAVFMNTLEDNAVRILAGLVVGIGSRFDSEALINRSIHFARKLREQVGEPDTRLDELRTLVRANPFAPFARQALEILER